MPVPLGSILVPAAVLAVMLLTSIYIFPLTVVELVLAAAALVASAFAALIWAVILAASSGVRTPFWIRASINALSAGAGAGAACARPGTSKAPLSSAMDFKFTLDI